MPDPRTMVFVGALDVDRDLPVVLNVPPGASVDEVKLAIEPPTEREAKAKAETEALANIFLGQVAIERGDK